MSDDVFCRVCSEPWSSYHLRHDTSPEERQKFYAGEGCESCGFGTRCTTCRGTGFEPKDSYLAYLTRESGKACPSCLDRYTVILRRRVFDNGTSEPAGADLWAMGYQPNYREVPLPVDEEIISRSEEYTKPETDNSYFPPKHYPGYTMYYATVRCFEVACREQQRLLGKCPRCGGDGKFKRDPAEDEKRELTFLHSTADTTDLDPMELLGPYFSAEALRRQQERKAEAEARAPATPLADQASLDL